MVGRLTREHLELNGRFLHPAAERAAIDREHLVARANGFTLVELWIVTAIIGPMDGHLTSLAPGYQKTGYKLSRFSDELFQSSNR
jgi:prepilin-type N-terminal cleavage/methylation domain-containing protein